MSRGHGNGNGNGNGRGHVALTRDQIKKGAVRRMIVEGDPGLPVKSEAELASSRRVILEAAPPGADVWLFGYGSLLWNPAFHHVETRTGRVYGYHRRFCLWTVLGRGDHANPGLMLGLDRGGSCRGVAFRIAAREVESELEIVWRREMLTAAYVPRWVEARTDRGRVRAIAFVINHRHERYAGLVPESEAAAAIASARGKLGPCADYLFNTVAHLEEIGIHDRALSKLNAQVASLRRRSGNRT